MAVTSPPSLDRALAAALEQLPPRRVQPVEVGGLRYWVKQCERPRLRLRLQKGDPGSAFRRERAALRALAGRALPVPVLAAEGKDFFAIPDVGPSLQKLLRRGGLEAAERRAACHAAGAALGALHAAGMAHGRPHLKDVCWQGGTATLIDFERFSPAGNSLRRQRNDLMMMVFSVLAEPAAGPEDLAALVAGYRAVAPAAPWQAAVRLARRLGWAVAPVGWLGALRRRRPGARDEFAALAPTLRYLAADGRPPAAM